MNIANISKIDINIGIMGSPNVGKTTLIEAIMRENISKQNDVKIYNGKDNFIKSSEYANIQIYNIPESNNLKHFIQNINTLNIIIFIVNINDGLNKINMDKLIDLINDIEKQKKNSKL